MEKQDFEARKESLLKDIREVMNDIEDLYNNSVEIGTEEGQNAKAKLQEKLVAAKEHLSRFEAETGDKIRQRADKIKAQYEHFEHQAGERLRSGKQRAMEWEREAEEQLKYRAKQADEAVREKPYYAMGFAALAGLVVGVLLNRR